MASHDRTAPRGVSPSRRLEAGRGGRAGERYWGTLSQIRGSGAATDFFLGGSLAPIGVTVSFLSATPGIDSLDRLVKWHKSLGQQLEINENPVGAPLGP